MNRKLERPLVSSPELRVGLGLPGALSARLDALVHRANEVGANTTRKELIAALVLEAPPDGDALMSRVVALRTAEIKDAVVSGDVADLYVNPEPGSKGPRRSPAQS